MSVPVRAMKALISADAKAMANARPVATCEGTSDTEQLTDQIDKTRESDNYLNGIHDERISWYF